MSPSSHIESLAQELAVTQEAADGLLRSVAAAGGTPDAYTMMRLDKLATACARLAYPNGLETSLSDSVRSLIAWCDHLDSSEWTAKFMSALKDYPLRPP